MSPGHLVSLSPNFGRVAKLPGTAADVIGNADKLEGAASNWTALNPVVSGIADDEQGLPSKCTSGELTDRNAFGSIGLPQ